jgi:hypothetical protein
VNVFTVEPERQAALVDLLADATIAVINRFPGYVSANIHRSLDGTKVVNYAQWCRVEDYEALLADPVAQQHISRPSSCPGTGQLHIPRITATRNSSKGGIMTQTDRQTVHAQAAFDRRGILDDVKARLSAISDTLSDSRIDVGQLREDVAELTAVTGRAWWRAARPFLRVT